MRHSHYGAVLHGRMCHECLLDVRWEYVEAAGEDHVPLSVYEIKPAVRVLVANIARVVPTMRARARCLLWIFVITLHDCVATNDDLAERAGRLKHAFLIHDLD